MRLPAVLLLLTALAHAQEGIVPITNWRVHSGDDPAWARPDFDDSQWAPPTDSYPQFNYRELQGWRWYRATVTLPASFEGADLAIGLGPINRCYEVYIEGNLAARFGQLTPEPDAPVMRNMTFSLPSLPHSRPLHIALRRWMTTSDDWTEFEAFGISATEAHPPAIGRKTEVELREALYTANGRLAHLPWNLAGLLMLGMAAIILVLYATQVRRAEFLYLGLFCLCTEGCGGYLGFPMVMGAPLLGASLYPKIVLAISMSGWVWAILLAAQVCPSYRRLISSLAAVQCLVGLMNVWSFSTHSLASGFWLRLLDVPTVIGAAVAAWGLARDKKSGSIWIAIALLAQYLGGISTTLFNLDANVRVGMLRVDIRSVATLVCVSTILTVLFLRFRKDQAKQAILEQDFAAARHVQQALLGAGSDAQPPGFTVDVAYFPAREVGGDFYQYIPGQDGSLLVVVGDVSGKGLNAAMLVASVLGALGNEPSRDPAVVLGNLNRAISGKTRGGFVTCCCALIHADGRMEIANAGHIPPYLGDGAVEVESGLPLGIVPDASYAATTSELGSSALTLVSDGVVEAENANRELFGFDRTREVSNQSAQAIAEAAREWGQNDDITVVTVRRRG